MFHIINYVVMIGPIDAGGVIHKRLFGIRGQVEVTNRIPVLGDCHSVLLLVRSFVGVCGRQLFLLRETAVEEPLNVELVSEHAEACAPRHVP
jgi:hypothetical protein